MLVSLSNASCLRNLRIERNAFGRLCYLLEHSGGMSNTKHMTVAEQVAMFLSVIAHHKKNYAVKHDFLRSGRIVSMHFHVVLNTYYKMSYVFLAKAAPIADDCSDPRWRWFKGCLCALDRTFIDGRVPEQDKGRYLHRKAILRSTSLEFAIQTCNSYMFSRVGKEVLQIAVFYVMQSINYMDFECHQTQMSNAFPASTPLQHEQTGEISWLRLCTMNGSTGLDYEQTL
ncbi:hypothetical protein Sango_0814100 [Sesamum angolense]|uniref:DUF8040 domain-containing protein n=1 Tax=Sesamum angolense TaxID=2727404 RepID=A0AAE1X391_9LAMI|nr:hypothetical protein Sango_0814100 [Sesamum angolense]